MNHQKLNNQNKPTHSINVEIIKSRHSPNHAVESLSLQNQSRKIQLVTWTRINQQLSGADKVEYDFQEIFSPAVLEIG